MQNRGVIGYLSPQSPFCVSCSGINQRYQLSSDLHLDGWCLTHVSVVDGS